MASENPGCCVWLIRLKKSCNERVSRMKELKHSIKMIKLEFYFYFKEARINSASLNLPQDEPKYFKKIKLEENVLRF
jgi:hypothetical protein